MRASAVAHMIKNDIALKEIADLYESYFSSGAEQLKDMTDADTEAFLSVAAEYDIGNCSAQEVIKGILFVVDAKSQTEQNKLIETVHKYISDNKLSKGKYERLNTLNASKVRSQLMDSVAALNSAEKIYDKYIEICDKLYDEQSDNQSSGGGGGGSSSGSKGSGGGVSLPAVSTPVAGTASSYTGSFADMTGHWSEAYVKECVTAGIINGYADNTFRPDAKITRAETTALIYKLFGLKSGNCNFADVSSDDWYFECVGAAYSSGIINGYSDGTFRPSDNISRQDIAVMLCRAVESAGYAFDGKTSFADGDSISAYASDSVSKLAAKGIITGDNGLFRPMDYLTRGEAAALVCRIKNIVYGGQR